jgi:hypothetical protein
MGELLQRPEVRALGVLLSATKRGYEGGPTYSKREEGLLRQGPKKPHRAGRMGLAYEGATIRACGIFGCLCTTGTNLPFT